ncbi:MAG: hypothetical protein ABR591_13140 [Candidatus Velthaea sp.]
MSDGVKRDPVETVKNDTSDMLDEGKERTKAFGEKLNRSVQGDDMPLGDRIASNVKEAGHDLKGDVDRGKRDIRDNT